MTKAAVFISLGLNFALMYSRMKPWCTDRLRWAIAGIVFLIGVMGFIFLPWREDDQYLVFSGNMLAPLVFNAYDRFLKKMSIKYQGRDFLLYLKGAEGVSVRWDENSKFTGTDKLFTGLLFLGCLGSVLLVALFRSKF